MKEVKDIPTGTIKIKSKDLLPYVKTKTSWKKYEKNLPTTKEVIELFKKHNNLKELIDKKNEHFLKGEISPKKEIKGARINMLPNGEKLTGAYSIFAKNLTIHDENSQDHWDVIYENPSGFCYLYKEEKLKKHKDKKFTKVKEFEKIYTKLEKTVLNALSNKKDYMSVPIFTLLKTHIRVGNEIYFKHNGHKGLTTLTKENVKIKNNLVTFKFIAKDGVPMTLTHEFPEIYIKRLKENIKTNKKYLFESCSNNILKETHFKKAFKRYAGKEFYPHIVRSFFATQKAKDFLSHNKKPSKKETRQLLTEIAHELGHRKFDKKNNTWKDSYNVTIHHYIAPSLAEKITKLAK